MKEKIDVLNAQLQAKKLFECLGITLEPETPKRFINMLLELTEFHNVSNAEIAKLIDKTFDFTTVDNSKNMVISKNIEAFSLCEHHIALIYDMKISVAYIPQSLILGLSKIVRAVKMVCKRITLQEKIGNDIVEIIQILTHTNDIAVHIRAKHSCITARGVENTGSETVTTNFSGKFLTNDTLKLTFLNSLN